jgi:hypothetical protein
MPTIQKAKILAFLQPLISVLSGAAAAWLFVHYNFLSAFTTRSDIAEEISGGVVFAITAGLSWLSQHQHLMPVTSALRAGILPPPLTFTAAELVAFLTPYISAFAGVLAAALFVHVHFLGFLHIGQRGVASAIASALVFAVTAVLTWLSGTLHVLPALRRGHLAAPPPIH